mmetsp:Transcript_3235/g.6772  ORF Transcript_3235/g.6772 Transcript_3235/m.6772 type:complete len:190 (-) Transcript_3235:268-837(-)
MTTSSMLSTMLPRRRLSRRSRLMPCRRVRTQGHTTAMTRTQSSMMRTIRTRMMRPARPRRRPSASASPPHAPSAEMLTFSKEVSVADELVGRSIIYHWPVVGWCVGIVKARNTDGRFTKMINGQRERVNFIIHYMIDDEEAKTALQISEYGGDEDGAWVLLEPAVAAAAVELAEPAAAEVATGAAVGEV